MVQIAPLYGASQPGKHELWTRMDYYSSTEALEPASMIYMHRDSQYTMLEWA